MWIVARKVLVLSYKEMTFVIYNLKLIRQPLNLSQNDFGKQLGVTRSAIAK